MFRFLKKIFSKKKKNIFKIEDIFDQGIKLYVCKRGGLVLGPLHKDGGIKVIRPISNSEFEVLFEMEGWEYLTFSDKVEYIYELWNINNRYSKLVSSDIVTDFTIPDGCNVIDVRNYDLIMIPPKEKTIVINRLSTQYCINEIIKIDNNFLD